MRMLHQLAYAGGMLTGRDMRRLLSSFQSSLEEITIIARPTDVYGFDAATKVLQLQSYSDPSRGE